MADTDLIIRRLEASTDVELYRDIRLEALRRNPEAYSSDYATESAWPLEAFKERLTDTHVIAGFRGDMPVGLAGLAINTNPKLAHKGFLWGVYVRPSARSAGVGRRLVEAVIALARDKVEILELSVERGNLPARRLYTSLGFVEYGLEARARKIGDRYVDDALMAKELDAA